MADFLLYDDGIIFDADDPDFDHSDADHAKMGEWRPGSSKRRHRENESGREGGREELHRGSTGYVC